MRIRISVRSFFVCFYQVKGNFSLKLLDEQACVTLFDIIWGLNLHSFSCTKQEGAAEHV